MANDYNQLLDDVFSAIDVIAQKRIESLDFNKTVKCSIVNNINADKGEYTVTDGSATFLAYSEKFHNEFVHFSLLKNLVFV